MKKEIKDIGNCEYEGCPNKAEYATFRLFKDGRKYWGHYCDKHERDIVAENATIRRYYYFKAFKEVE